VHTTRKGFKISTKKEKKFKKTSEMMEGFYFVILIIGFSRPNTGKNDSFQTGSEAYPASCPMATRALCPKVKWLGCEADHLPPSSGEVKNDRAIPPLPPYVFMVWCLIN
jgi:hypothetical protein